MPTASIKFFDDKKGFGFIKQDDAGQMPAFRGTRWKRQRSKARRRLCVSATHPIIGRMVATQIRLIDEERQAAQRAE